MKTLLPILLAATMLSSGCVNSGRTIVIDDLSKEKKQLLRSDQEHPYAIRLTVKGKTDGAFSIMGFNLHGGVIDTSFLVDWYADTLMFHYKPITTKTGRLKIQYDF